MKAITRTIQVLVGLLFMFSGFVKFNDPEGFSYKMEEYFEVFADDLNVVQDSVRIIITDHKENHVMHDFLLPPGVTYQVATVKATTDEEPLIMGEDTFLVNQVEVKIDREWVFDEMWLTKDPKQEGSVDIVFTMGEEPYRMIKTSFGEWESVEREFTLNWEESLKKQPWASRFFESLIPYALVIGMFICIFELILGFSLLIGYKKGLTLYIMLMMIVFFTFLTGYSAVYNKVTDCGCFGDAIKLTPWESFWKDIILTILILWLFVNQRFIRSLFSVPFMKSSVAIIALLSTAYSVYALMYLPPINFLNFAKGNDIYERTQIPPGKPTRDSVAFEYYYKEIASGEIQKFSAEEAPVGNKKYEFVDRTEKVLVKAYKPPLDNFSNIMHPEMGDVADSILQYPDYQLLVVSQDFSKASPKHLQKLVTMLTDWDQHTDYPIWFLTGSTPAVKEAFEEEYTLPVSLLTADKTFIKSIVRSNPGIVLLKGSKVVKNWPARRIPSYKRISKRLK